MGLQETLFSMFIHLNIKIHIDSANRVIKRLCCLSFISSVFTFAYYIPFQVLCLFCFRFLK